MRRSLTRQRELSRRCRRSVRAIPSVRRPCLLLELLGPRRSGVRWRSRGRCGELLAEPPSHVRDPSTPSLAAALQRFLVDSPCCLVRNVDSKASVFVPAAPVSKHREIPGCRLVAQHLASPRLSAVELVQAMGGIQAQEYAGALWAVGLRTRGETLATIEAALAAGTIVRTHPMRGTHHFVARE